MTSFDYARATATAQRLIARFGQSATLQRITNSGTSYNPTRTPADHACTVVVLDFDDTLVDGTRIKKSDRRVIMSTAGLTIEPTTTDKLIVDGQTYAVHAVTSLNPGGTTVYWELQARV